MNHTPIPWAVEEPGDGSVIITSPGAEKGEDGAPNLDDDVAQFYGGNGEDPDRAKADAEITCRAVNAYPAMFEALLFCHRQILEYVEWHQKNGGCSVEMERAEELAREAIQKAEPKHRVPFPGSPS